MYLVDGKNNKIVAYATNAELNEMLSDSTVKYTHSSGSTVDIPNYGSYDIYSHVLTGARVDPITGEGKCQAFNISFTSDETALYGYGSTGAAGGAIDPDALYWAVATNNDPSKDAYDDQMAWSAKGGISYNAAYTYAQSTPEPTSAVLLLLGMAGLALKRKVA